jgi:hypothetical protein
MDKIKVIPKGLNLYYMHFISKPTRLSRVHDKRYKSKSMNYKKSNTTKYTYKYASRCILSKYFGRKPIMKSEIACSRSKILKSFSIDLIRGITLKESPNTYYIVKFILKSPNISVIKINVFAGWESGCLPYLFKYLKKIKFLRMSQSYWNEYAFSQLIALTNYLERRNMYLIHTEFFFDANYTVMLRHAEAFIKLSQDLHTGVCWSLRIDQTGLKYIQAICYNKQVDDFFVELIDNTCAISKIHEVVAKTLDHKINILLWQVSDRLEVASLLQKWTADSNGAIELKINKFSKQSSC